MDAQRQQQRQAYRQAYQQRPEVIARRNHLEQERNRYLAQLCPHPQPPTTPTHPLM